MNEREGKKEKKKKQGKKKKEEKPPKVRQFLLPRFSFARSFATKRIQKASSSVRAARIKRNETKRCISFERAAIEAEGGGRQGCTISQRAEWTRHLTCQDRRARGEYKRRWEERKEGGKEEQLIIARVKVGVASYICISHRCLLIRLASR